MPHLPSKTGHGSFVSRNSRGMRRGPSRLNNICSDCHGNLTNRNYLSREKIELDAVVYTHEHQDHLYVPFLKEIIKKFPNVEVIGNESIVSFLQKEGIAASSTLPEWLTQESAQHEPLLPGMMMCPNMSYTFFGRLTHPGDSLHFSKTAEILALPVTAPWGSMTWAIEKALEVKPKIIIPIHDWHWKDEARVGMYGMMKGIFEKNDIDFRSVESGEPLNV